MEKSDRLLDALGDPSKEGGCCGGGSGGADTEGGRKQGRCYFPKRHLVVALLFLGQVICNAQRVNIGVTVIAILHHRAPPPPPPLQSNDNETETETDDRNSISNLKWTPEMVGWLHAIFYVGSLISQIPFGYLVVNFPSHRLFGGCILLTCLLNFLLPVAIETVGYVLTCIIRLAQGLTEGLLYPACYDVLRIWTLPEEKSRAGATVLTGSYIGPMLGMIFSGLLTHFFGWVYVFYAHGLVGVLWSCIWFFCAYENPSVHPTISNEEKKLIESRQGEAALIYEQDQVPWKAIFTSLPVYSLIACNFARSFVFYMLLQNQPAYLNTFNFTIAENGLYSSLPYAFMALFCVVGGAVADHLMSKSLLSATAVRKLLTGVGYGMEATFFFGLALINQPILAIVFLTMGVGFSGIAISGWQINHLDLAPRYAGILVAITMTFGTLAGIFNPLIVAALTEDQTLASWHNVFWLTGGVIAVATIFFLIFGSGERQSWAVPRPPSQRVVTNSEPLSSKPYGTFTAQSDYPPLPSPLTMTKLESKSDDSKSDEDGDEEEEEEEEEERFSTSINTTSFNGEESTDATATATQRQP